MRPKRVAPGSHPQEAEGKAGGKLRNESVPPSEQDHMLCLSHDPTETLGCEAWVLAHAIRCPVMSITSSPPPSRVTLQLSWQPLRTPHKALYTQDTGSTPQHYYSLCVTHRYRGVLEVTDHHRWSCEGAAVVAQGLYKVSNGDHKKGVSAKIRSTFCTV